MTAWKAFCEAYDLLENATGDEEWLNNTSCGQGRMTDEEPWMWEHCTDL